MHYAIVDVDVGVALPSVPLTPRQAGLGVLVRRGGRPISFSLHALPPGALVPPGQLRRLILDAVGADILAAAIGDEISPPPQAPSPVDLTVAVCNRGAEQSLERCVGALRALRSTGPNFDTLVVQHGPRATTTGAANVAIEGVRVSVASSPRLADARNLALRTARTEWVAFVDDDVQVDHGWLNGLRSAVLEHDDAAVVTGLVLPSELTSEAQIRFERGEGHRRGFDRRRLQGPRLPGEALYPFDTSAFVTSCNMAYRRHAALALGGFDEALSSGSPLQHATDMDMAFRMLRSGQPLVHEPRMLVFRRHPVTRAALRHDYRAAGSGLGEYLAKTYTTQASERHALRGVARVLLRRHLRELRHSLDGRASVPPDLTVAQLAGGFTPLAKASRAIRDVRRSGWSGG